MAEAFAQENGRMMHYATLLISAHQDVKTVSARLGHAQTSTTMDIYTHALRENDRPAADARKQLLGGDDA